MWALTLIWWKVMTVFCEEPLDSEFNILLLFMNAVGGMQRRKLLFKNCFPLREKSRGGSNYYTYMQEILSSRAWCSYLWLRCSRAGCPEVKEPSPRWRTHQRRPWRSARTLCRCRSRWRGQGRGRRSARWRCCQKCHHQWTSRWCRPSDRPF